jgi:hypothetical protein
MTITQTVEIPASRRITLEVPPEVPVGATARLELIWSLQREAAEEGKYAYQKLQGIHRNLPGASVDKFLAGCYTDKEQELAKEKHEAPLSP